MNTKSGYGGERRYNNNYSSFGIRAAASPHDEQGARVPAVSFVMNMNKNNKNNNKQPRGRMNNGNVQAKRNNGNNNYGKKNFNPNWRRKFNSAANNNNNPPPRKMVTEKVIVDYVSPGEDGNELYLFTQGDFVNVEKVEGQPLVIDPIRVNYTGGKEKEGEEEEKELWEKLCAENSITVTFDALTWEVTDIVSDEALIWARGKSPPRRRRSSWANNPGYGSREQWEQNCRSNEKKAKIKGGSPPERREKAKKPDPTKRRGSLPSVREFKAAVLSASAPPSTTSTSGITTNADSNSNEDFASRMEKLEKANMELQNQLEEAKTKIKVLEDKSTPTQDPGKSDLTEDVKASPVL